ncbi:MULTISPECIES: hypothetical protein [Clostridia]|uniref:hypothetical protein n=1 Tax=Clostridia TaxID=186801 RepID=UPI000EA3DE43|nr:MULTISPECIES: hypothetical protein [Clostridia]NBJ71603.1 hypothetical protein [Roseburia sp. 1XD42-34]RKI74103.1 hypothetical protein D7V87_19515 [Clostridium sp. 1xD42-85]
MLRSDIFGKYKGRIYEITIDMENNMKIMTEDKDKIDTTLEDKYNSGLYTKVVKRNEITDCVSIVPYGIINGEKVQILKEKEDKFQVSSASLLVGSNLKLPRIDRDTWLGWVPKSEVRVIEEKTPINPQEL